jgi:hypothetical protein
MIKVLQYVFVGIIVSFYFFTINFSFLPIALNTKVILALFGVLLLGYNSIVSGSIQMSRGLLGAIFFAAIFSIICAISADINHTDDYAYATYIVSFAVWLFAAYAVCVLIKGVHGKVDLYLVGNYLIAVCVAQCVLALMIDNIEPFKAVVDRFVIQGQEFYDEVERLYGIGAALDNAGVRFSVVLLILSAIVSKNPDIRNNRLSLTIYIISFFVILLIGNMISRTTSVGGGLALGYLVLNTGIFTFIVKKKYFKFHAVFFSILIIAVAISVYLYNTNKNFHDDIRFAFEGFFNWVELGEWKTGSTDKLNREMWIWPTDTKTWIIGSGLFDNFVYSTDIGYCRFILYCGIIGLSSFGLFFVYNALVFGRKNKKYFDLFLFLLALTFIVWLKVSTDIFLIYALFYCIEALNFGLVMEEKKEIYEDSILHPRYI